MIKVAYSSTSLERTPLKITKKNYSTHLKLVGFSHSYFCCSVGLQIKEQVLQTQETTNMSMPTQTAIRQRLHITNTNGTVTLDYQCFVKLSKLVLLTDDLYFIELY
ncbi:hypothetical protein [Candidatus Mesenet endosymbiont of Agriotes lineatus]|uniref:hypothetical protein n=1 Tax=Candidatus Mesenet endosymbiont of Agriotes lineatus TaxID=3077948 RepID=UPI0030CF7931